MCVQLRCCDPDCNLLKSVCSKIGTPPECLNWAATTDVRERQSACLICISVFASNTVYGDEARNTTQQHVTVHIVMMTCYCANMSTPPVPVPYRRYNDGQWLTYVTEAIQSGNHKQYCSTHNIEYRSFKRKYAEYNQIGIDPTL